MRGGGPIRALQALQDQIEPLSLTALGLDWELCGVALLKLQASELDVFEKTSDE